MKHKTNLNKYYKKPMSTLARWTEEEDAVVYETIASKNESLNLVDAFEKAAKKLGRTPTAVNFRWYTKLRKKDHTFNIKADKAQVSNVKNNIRHKTQPVVELEKAIVHLIDKLDEGSKKQLITNLIFKL